VSASREPIIRVVDVWKRFGARQLIGQLVAIALLRELVPVLIALVVGGRLAAGIAAELGSMTVTEQVDAVRALGADPIQKLVVPRIAAAALCVPVLTALGDVLGFLGAAFIARLQYSVALRLFVRSALDFATVTDLFHGLIKSVCFGIGVALIACHFGLRSRGGTAGVGFATTQAVVVGSLFVVMSDFFLTKLLLVVQP
jgi:phospholipid/cholesterol/gamma-HCH transport system permease protein